MDFSDTAKIQLLQSILETRLESVLEALGLSLQKRAHYYMGSCPVHGGDNRSALNLYYGGDVVTFKCRTKFCQKVFKPTLIGFIRGVLSNQKYSWTTPGDKTVSFHETIKWCLEFLGQNWNDLKPDRTLLEKTSFINKFAKFQQAQTKGLLTRQEVRSRLAYPCSYLLNRGYSPELLDKYDVGICTSHGKELNERCVVPCYDELGYFIGATGRSLYEECTKCKCWHNPKTICPSEQYRPLYRKWKNSANLNVEHTLFNYWNCKKQIKESGSIILVEGPLDCLRLIQAGITNVVALFGLEFCDGQRILVEKSGAYKMILLLDNDEPGKSATEKIASEMKRLYNVTIPAYDGHDIGGLDLPCIDKLRPYLGV